ncbi:hypothetical protein Tco_1123013 [Tanacetum coccineum]|uniref:Uncharacterized protein n=1 Tax=Tanacetum coccineum TaxID=301880 RepID=A0ABQ5J4Q2_9ASTR
MRSYYGKDFNYSSSTNIFIPYPRFTKIIISHYMTNFPEISRRVRDRRSTRLTPPALMPTIDKADEMILKDTLQKMREEEEITDEVYELKQREKWKIVEDSRGISFPTPIRSPRIHTDLVSSNTENSRIYGTAHTIELLSLIIRPRDQDDPHDDAHPEGENSAKWQKTFEYETHVTGESSGQIKNFLKSAIVWESRKEILASPHPQKTTPLVQSCQRDPEAPALSLINQDLLYLKKGSSGPKKIVLSLHMFPAIIFNDVDIEERTSRWVNKCVKKFNPYARDLNKDELEYLKLFEEEIEVRLKYRNQMRRWEMYVNERPLGPRRERLE